MTLCTILLTVWLSVQGDQTPEDIEDLRSRCADIQESVLLEALKSLPKLQQEAVKACLNAAKDPSSSRARSLNTWILECLLLRIRSRKAYNYIRERNVAPLPTLESLQSHLEKLEPSSAFCADTLAMLRNKSSDLKPHERRGMD